MKEKIQVCTETIYGDEIVFEVYRNGDVVNTYNDLCLCNIVSGDNTNEVLDHYLALFKFQYTRMWRNEMSSYIEQIESFIKKSGKFGFTIQEVDGQYICTTNCQRCGKVFKCPVELIFANLADEDQCRLGTFGMRWEGLKEYCRDCEIESAQEADRDE